MKNIIEHEISQITKSILDDYGTGRNIDKMDLFNQPSKEEIIAIVEDLLKIVYPGYYRDRSYKIYNIKSNSTVTIEDVAYHLNKQILLALKYTAKEENDVEKLTEQAEKDTDYIPEEDSGCPCYAGDRSGGSFSGRPGCKIQR